MKDKKAITGVQTAVIAIAILVVVVGGSYAFIASTPPKTVVQTQVQTQTQIQTQTLTQVQKLRQVTMLLGWIPSPRYLPFYAAKEQGFYAEEGLDVTVIGGQGSNFAIQQVDAKKVEFGAPAFVSLVTAVGKGSPIISVGIEQDKDPAAIASWAKDNVQTPLDLTGKSFASTAFSGCQNLLWASIKLWGGDPDQTKLAVTSAQLQTKGFLEGNYPLTCNYLDNDRPFLLDEVKTANKPPVKHHSLSDWIEAKAGFALFGNVLIVHVDTIKSDPQMVKAFLRATHKGVIWAYNNPEKAVQSLLRLEPGAGKTEVLLEGWNTAKNLYVTQYVRQYGLGFADSDKLAKNIQLLADTFKLPTTPVDKIHTNAYLDPLIKPS